jgi:hypothetical protein
MIEFDIKARDELKKGVDALSQCCEGDFRSSWTGMLLLTKNLVHHK